MKKSLEITLRDVFGGDGQIRFEDRKVSKLERRKTTTKKKSDIGISVSSSMDEVTTELRKVEIQTFRYQNGYPVMRLGGIHGKLWGALEEARRTLYMLGDPSFRSKGITQSIQIQPMWVQLNPLEKIRTETLPQILNTPSRSMITQQYDVIPKCTIKITLICPDNLDRLVEKLFAQVQSMGLLNKRRAIIEEVREL